MIVDPSVGRFDGHEIWFPINDRLVFVGALKLTIQHAKFGPDPELSHASLRLIAHHGCVRFCENQRPCEDHAAPQLPCFT
ncbi:MAG: hypothetical protein CMM01_01595 [Rhodopirellula sp.]|nr:hypothetical protein [Rhodopirellula sp.]OUX52403.1 MAG: hypothetical protein CBE43_00755 [Rhodopirellula sp. TMED283]